MSKSKSRGSTSITVEMLVSTVEELQMHRSTVTSKMIAFHIARRYPIDKNPKTLRIELKDKLDYAVSRGILSRCDWDTYCLPTFRQKTYNDKTDLSSFWERYYKKRPGRHLRPLPLKNNMNPKKNADDSDDSSDYFYDSDDE